MRNRKIVEITHKNPLDRSKFLYYLSGGANFLAQHNNYYKEKLESVFGKSVAEECQVPYEAVIPYMPEEFSFTDHRYLTDKQMDSAKRIIYVACKRENRGLLFIQGFIPDITCTLLKYLNEEQTFAVVRCLLQKPEFNAYSNFDCNLFSPTLIMLIKDQTPALYDHIEKLKVSQSFSELWFTRIFCGILNEKIIFRILDNLIIDGLKILFKLALAVMRIYSAPLLKCKHSTDFMDFLSKCQRRIQPESKDSTALFAMAYSISLKTDHVLHTMSQIRNMMLPANIANLSDIIDAEQIATLFSWIPSRYKLREIERIYSPRKMGFNLNTMITKCGKRDPTLLVMKSNTGNVFGAYVAANWERDTCYKGGGEFFVFTLTHNSMRKFPWNKTNNFFLMVDQRSFQIGGSENGKGGCAIWLDDELHKGFSDFSPTFDSECLNGEKTEFECVELEMFAFK